MLAGGSKIYVYLYARVSMYAIERCLKLRNGVGGKFLKRYVYYSRRIAVRDRLDASHAAKNDGHSAALALLAMQHCYVVGEQLDWFFCLS